ncbi:MAG: methyltransferase domain-containing protein [Flavobacteriales bacterium]|nr:methyltransferase domain-containing protein [Flavobacteriales bacterium]
MRPAVTVFNSVADIYTEKFFDVSLYKNSLDLLLANLSSGDRLCDLACGPGNISYYFNQAIPDLFITGIDLSENMLKVASEKMPNANFILNDIASFRDVLHEKQHLFVCGFGIPYLSTEELDTMLSEMAIQLVESGMVYLSFMCGEDQTEKVYASHDTSKFIHTNFHSELTVKDLAQKKGFELIHTNRLEAPSKDVEMIFRLSH